MPIEGSRIRYEAATVYLSSPQNGKVDGKPKPTKIEAKLQRLPNRKLGLAAYQEMWAEVGPPDTSKLSYVIQNPDSVKIVGQTKPYTHMFSKKGGSKLLPETYKIFEDQGLTTKGWSFAHGSRETTNSVLKRFDRKEPPCPDDDPALEKATESFLLQLEDYLHTVLPRPYDQREASNKAAGPIGDYFYGEPVKKHQFLQECFDHCRQLRKDINDPTTDIGKIIIMSKGVFKKEILKTLKVIEHRERLFMAADAAVVDIFQELFGNMNKLFTYQRFATFAAGWSPQGGGYDKMMNTLRNCYRIYEGDCETFDTTLWAVLQKKLYMIRWNLFTPWAQKEYYRLFEFCVHQVLHHYIQLPTGHVMYVKNRNDSGQYDTSSDGSGAHCLAHRRMLFKHYPDMPLDVWHYKVEHFMSDDHLNGDFTHHFVVSREDAFAAYFEVGLILNPKDDHESFPHLFEGGFDEAIQTHSFLGSTPRKFTLYSGRTMFVPYPKNVEKLVASCLLSPSRNAVHAYQRLASIATSGYFCDPLFTACKDSIDLAIRRGVITADSLRHKEKSGLEITYPSRRKIENLWVGFQGSR